MHMEMIVLMIICLGFMLLLAGICRQIKKINQVLDEIIKGETDRRILIRKHSFLSDTCYKLNQIMMDNKERIIKTKRLERRNEELMTGLSHDIRTPLTSIIGHLDAVYYQYVHGEMNAESVRQAPITGHCPIGQALSFCQELKHKSKKHCIGTVMNLSLR